MKFFQVLFLFLFLSLATSTAFAKCGNDLAYKKLDELPTFSGTPASGDMIGVCDTSENRLEKMDASAVSFGTISATLAPTADHATTKIGASVVYTVPAHTTGTNVDYGMRVVPTISNATGGTNIFGAMRLESITGDAQVTEVGMSVGSGYDVGLATDSPVQINTVNGTAISAFRFAFDAVASGQTSKTTTLTGVTASSRCVASAAEVATNAVYVRAVVPGTDQVVITTSGDPGASNLDYTVICLN